MYIAAARPTKEAVDSVVSQPHHSPMLELVDQMDRIDGRAVDLTDGRIDGRAVNLTDGRIDGTAVDLTDGRIDGRTVDLTDGSIDGRAVDLTDGRIDGRAVDLTPPYTPSVSPEPQNTVYVQVRGHC